MHTRPVLKSVLLASLLGLVGLASLAMASDEPDKAHGVALYLDQDLFVPATNEDRDYTFGLAAEVLIDKNNVDCFYCLLKSPLDNWLVEEKGRHIRRSATFGMVMYTPDDLGNPNPIFNDRPYASLFYLSSKDLYDQNNQGGRSVIGTELQIGLLGLELAETLQRSAHELYRNISGDSEPVNPRGWDHQISDGGEPVLRYQINYMQQLEPADYADLSWVAQTNLGYQTNASLGLLGRVGMIAPPPWTVPLHPIERGGFGLSRVKTKSSGAYVWAYANLRAVAYNALLQGQFRNSEVTVSSSDMERLMLEGALGITGYLSDDAEVTVAWQYKSAAMKAKPNSPADHDHIWGGVYATIYFD